MSHRRLTCVVVVAILPALLTAAKAAPRQSAPHYTPRFEAVAETKLLMEGLAGANFHGLEGLLKKEPADAEAWAFARGQALLLAETGNLLLIRPPRTPEGQDAWFRHATDLRDAASALARSAGSQDFTRSRAGLADVANSCNRCHQTFRVATRIGAAAREGGRP
jgi:cytochrome c556